MVRSGPATKQNQNQIESDKIPSVVLQTIQYTSHNSHNRVIEILLKYKISNVLEAL